MKINRRLPATALAAALAGTALSLAAPAATASSVTLKITESWSGSVPSRVEPGQTVTLLTSFGQDTYDQPIQISGLSFNLWASSTVGHDVQVQFLNPVTHAWVSVGPDNAQSWTYEFDTFLTEQPGQTYSSGVRFTISDKAPAGQWTVQYPTVWGVTTQTALPYGSISFPSGPTRTFTFKSAAAPTPTHTTRPTPVTTTHAAAATRPSPTARQVATSAAPATSAAAVASMTDSMTAAAGPSTAAPSAAPVNVDLAASTKPAASATPALAVGAAAAAFFLLLALGLWRRLRGRGV